MRTKKVGMYIHIPFCKQKCSYCDFKSYSGKDELIEKYVKWLIYELIQIAEGNKSDYENNLDDLVVIDTIYIGGGTPSYIDSKYIVEIINTIKKYYSMLENPEITIEVNPGTVTKRKLQDYINCGINRISVGLQSANEYLLKQLGRIHTFEEFENTYKLIREVGFNNVNVDLMIGLPNQTIEDVNETLNKILQYSPEHISAYSLIVEEETKLCKDIETKKIKLPDEEIERKMYWTVKNKLQENGYIHYEISNFSKHNYQSKHNMNCWNQKEYIGVGVAAHSYTNNVRYSNVEAIEQYIKNFETNNEIENFVFHEKQNKESKMKEYMLLGLRKIKGVQIKEFKNKFSENPIYLYRKELEKLVKEELIEIDGDSIILTEKGLDFANLVWEEFI